MPYAYEKPPDCRIRILCRFRRRTPMHPLHRHRASTVLQSTHQACKKFHILGNASLQDLQGQLGYMYCTGIDCTQSDMEKRAIGAMFTLCGARIAVHSHNSRSGDVPQ